MNPREKFLHTQKYHTIIIYVFPNSIDHVVHWILLCIITHTHTHTHTYTHVLYSLYIIHHISLYIIHCVCVRVLIVKTFCIDIYNSKHISLCLNTIEDSFLRHHIQSSGGRCWTTNLARQYWLIISANTDNEL